MEEKRKPFFTLGKSKFSKVANFIVLVLLLAYAASKLGLISPTISKGYEYTIPASELHVSTQQELSSKLSNYVVNKKALAVKLQKINITMKEFKNNVSMEFIVSSNQNGLKGLVVEFQSNIPREKLKPIYNYLVNDVKTHIINNKG